MHLTLIDVTRYSI